MATAKSFLFIALVLVAFVVSCKKKLPSTAPIAVAPAEKKQTAPDTVTVSLHFILNKASNKFEYVFKREMLQGQLNFVSLDSLTKHNANLPEELVTRIELLIENTGILKNVRIVNSRVDVTNKIIKVMSKKHSDDFMIDGINVLDIDGNGTDDLLIFIPGVSSARNPTYECWMAERNSLTLHPSNLFNRIALYSRVIEKTRSIYVSGGSNSIDSYAENWNIIKNGKLIKVMGYYYHPKENDSLYEVYYLKNNKMVKKVFTDEDKFNAELHKRGMDY